MICFRLTCAAAHEFEGWFRDNDGFEEQSARGDLTCPVCGDREVRKAIMAPAVARSAEAPEGDPRRAFFTKMLQVMRSVREHVEANFENVGEQFPEEARKIHYGETEHRDIFGEATGSEARELIEEGIAIHPLPMIPKLDG